jgi:hypothetical protein
MDDRASMLCARVIRGISSIEKAVTPVAAIFGGASLVSAEDPLLGFEDWTGFVVTWWC